MDAEIPADILEAAEAVFQTEIVAGQPGGVFIKERIARALLAERERAANIVANGYLDLKEMRRLTALIRS